MGKIRAGIVGVGSYAPEKIMTNLDLEKIVDTSDAWITERTGIKERRISTKQDTSDLAAEAGMRAITDAGIKKEEIELVVVATASPDMIFPSTACNSLAKMGLKNIPAFDVMAACTGLSYAISVCTNYVENGTYKTVLLIGAEVMSRFIDWSDRNTCILFGDGAGALLLRATDDDAGILGTFLSADTDLHDLLNIPAGGSSLPASERTVHDREHYIKMKGRDVFKFAVRAIDEASRKVLEQTGYKIDEVDYFIPHQANYRIIEAAAEKLKIPSGKIVSNIEKYGNTSTASIIIALDEMKQAGKLKKGDLILSVGFGAGLTWGANLIKW